MKGNNGVPLVSASVIYHDNPKRYVGAMRRYAEAMRLCTEAMRR